MIHPILSDPSAAVNLIDAALEYRARGWSIIPVNGKVAAGLWKPFQTQPADEPTLRRMFRPNVSGIAVILGSVSSGLACRDYDDAGAYHAWSSDHPDLAATLPTVQTSRGFHVYHRAAVESYVVMPDGEYRADSRHYCLLPPSVHPDGLAYAWKVPLSELPLIDPVVAGFTQAETQERPKHTQAYTLHVSDLSNEVIRITLPSGPGQRNRKLFDLARRLKAIMPDAAPAGLEPIVRQWFEAALPVIRTKDWLTTWIDFRTAWLRVKRPVGATLAAIIGEVPDADAIEKLANACRALQAHHGEGVAWPLSCRTAGSIIGMGHDTGARILKLLCAENVIELVTPAGKKGSKKAAEYRFTGGK